MRRYRAGRGSIASAAPAGMAESKGRHDYGFHRNGKADGRDVIIGFGAIGRPIGGRPGLPPGMPEPSDFTCQFTAENGCVDNR